MAGDLQEAAHDVEDGFFVVDHQDMAAGTRFRLHNLGGLEG